MFKSILPSSKRNGAADAPAHQRQASVPATPEAFGKENHRPQHPLARSSFDAAPGRPALYPAVRKDLDAAGKSQMGPTGTQRVAPSKDKENAGRLLEAGAMNRAFEKMLDDMQIPSTLRPKLITLDSPVKAAMLKSSQTLGALSAALAEAPETPSKKAPTVRKTKSTDTLGSGSPFPRPNAPFHHGHSSSFDGNSSPISQSPQRPHSGSFATAEPFSKDIFKPAVFDNSGGAENSSKAKKLNKDKGGKEKDLTPEAMALWLANTKSTVIDVEKVKKLRMMLRNEAASWSETFLTQGGYSALLSRLNELLEVEWREEQHDDQALHELLRCFKALATSSIGCFALRSSCPSPFVQLVALLYSDKKPGDVCSRQLIVDLLLILYELYPSAATKASNSSAGHGIGTAILDRRNAWESKGSGHVIPPARPTVFTRPSSPPPALPQPHTSTYELLRATLLTPRPAPSECPSAPVDPHAFIASLHTPRIYKTYISEVSDIKRDYFWVFCHPNNTIWDLEVTDDEKVEKPRAPGGMTGGVEFEAMTYLTTHFRLINTLCRAAAELNLPPSDEKSAYKLHADLFASGLEPIILTARKASTVYYPTLHLEIARYVAHAIHARYLLPYGISRLIGLPPPALQRRKAPAPQATGSLAAVGHGPSNNTTRTGVNHPPSLPPRREMRFD
ncbi:hypothetical protein FRC03_004582 [Tulasnella sp. 419]|nr:hypothetical protein FRC03_004582 [Tulasnella sp. 419]